MSNNRRRRINVLHKMRSETPCWSLYNGRVKGQARASTKPGTEFLL